MCRRRGLPVITVINKWDHPGLDALALMDEIEQRIDLRPTPLTWPVGVAGTSAACWTGEPVSSPASPVPPGVRPAPEQTLSPGQAAAEEGGAWATAVEESELLRADGADLDGAYLAGKSTPTLFGAAVQNFGVGQLLRVLIELGRVSVVT